MPNKGLTAILSCCPDTNVGSWIWLVAIAFTPTSSRRSCSAPIVPTLASFGTLPWNSSITTTAVGRGDVFHFSRSAVNSRMSAPAAFWAPVHLHLLLVHSGRIARKRRSPRWAPVAQDLGGTATRTYVLVRTRRRPGSPPAFCCPARLPLSARSGCGAAPLPSADRRVRVPE